MGYTDGLMAFGWKCPDCGRVYSPTSSQCYPCNGKIAEARNNPRVIEFERKVKVV